MKDPYKVYSRYLEEDEVGEEWEKFDRNRKIFVWKRAYIFDRELNIPYISDICHIHLKSHITNIENVLEFGFGNKLSITIHFNYESSYIYYQPDYSEFLTVGKGVRIGNNNIFNSNVSVCDNVKIKNGNRIWDYSRLGNNVSIGSHCAIGDSAQIGDYVTIGNHVSIFRCDIGDNCQFGNYTYVRGSKIGSNCKIGIGKDIMGEVEINRFYGKMIPCLNETRIKSCKMGNNVTIGKKVHLWSNVSVDDGAIINDNCTIGSNVRIGANAVIEAGTKVPSGTTIEPGAVVNSKTFA